jgi:hypothetical protein
MRRMRYTSAHRCYILVVFIFQIVTAVLSLQSDRTALMWACVGGHADTAVALLNSGARHDLSDCVSVSLAFVLISYHLIARIVAVW